MKKRKNKKQQSILEFIIIILMVLVWFLYYFDIDSNAEKTSKEVVSYNLTEIPQYQDTPYVIINNNIPYFEESDYKTEAFENYSELDVLGRCGVAYANICKEIMPQKRR